MKRRAASRIEASVASKPLQMSISQENEIGLACGGVIVLRRYRESIAPFHLIAAPGLDNQPPA